VVTVKAVATALFAYWLLCRHTSKSGRPVSLELNDQSLVPGDDLRIGLTRFEEWLNQSKR